MNKYNYFSVIDRMFNEVKSDNLSEQDAMDLCAILNSAADFFCYKPRFKIVGISKTG